MCCGDNFDRDELGLDPEEDEDEVELCETCGELVEDCECTEEDEDAATGL